MYQCIEVFHDNLICRIKLNRPEARNAFNPSMIEELSSVFSNLDQDTKTKLVHISGNGPSFCSGADLSWMQKMAQYNFQDNLTDARQMFHMFEMMMKCPHPIIATVHGHVYGGGLGIVSQCDVVLADENTKFCFSEVKLGLVPAVISPFVSRKISFSNLNELFLTARIFDSDEAKKMHLIHQVWSNAELEMATENLLKEMSENGIEAMHECKRLLRYIQGETWDSVRSETTTVIAERRMSIEAQIKLQKFFKGKQ